MQKGGTAAITGTVTEQLNDDASDDSMLEIDNEILMEDELAKLTRRIELLKKHEKTMRIGKNQF